MICDTCHGTGKTIYSAPYMPALGLYTCSEIPCEACGGCGTAHCCEGLREQPDSTPLFTDDLDTHDPGGRALPLPAGVRATAIYGGPRDCHRYLLDWLWDGSLPCLLAGMMNPSAATHRVSDGTLSWLHRWACRNGFGRLIVVNGSSYRCRDQARLAEVDDPCGPDNHAHIRAAARVADVVVAGYGQPKVRAARPHGPRMVEILREVGKPIHVWALSKDGTPKHPLYLPGAVPLTIWEARR